MPAENATAEHWGKGDVYALILSALKKAGKSLDAPTVEDLAPVDHFHARGFAATVDIADSLPVNANYHLPDAGYSLVEALVGPGAGPPPNRH